VGRSIDSREGEESVRVAARKEQSSSGRRRIIRSSNNKQPVRQGKSQELKKNDAVQWK